VCASLRACPSVFCVSCASVESVRIADCWKRRGFIVIRFCLCCVCGWAGCVDWCADCADADADVDGRRVEPRPVDETVVVVVRIVFVVIALSYSSVCAW